MRTAEELWDQLRAAYELPYGAAQMAVYDQLLPHVDASGDDELAFTSRMLATTGYVYGGEPAKAFVTFARCVSDFDNRPAPHHARMAHTLLWDFKAMINALMKFPEVPLDRTYAVIDDMERRYREGGHSMQAVYKQRYQVAQHLGDPAADGWYERWVTAARDDLSDCVGCDPSDKAAYLAFHGRDEEVVALAEPVLAGELTCTEQPQTILNELMAPYLRTGRLDAAADAHRRAYRLQRHKLADLADLGSHIAFCARTGNEHRGLEILQRHVDWLEKAPSPSAEMWFAASAALLLNRLVRIGHGDTPVTVGGRDVPAEALAGELTARATGIAARFDARNGTGTQTRRITERIAAEPYDVLLPLSPTARRAPVAPPVVPAPAVVVPADAGPEDLLDLAEQHQRDDRDADATAVLAAFDARFPDPEEPLIAGRRGVLRGGEQWQSDRAAAIGTWEHAAELLDKAGRPDEASATRGRLGVAYCLDGRVDDGLALVRGDLEHQQEHGAKRDEAAAWSRLSTVHLIRDEPADANAAQDRADALAAEAGEPRQIALYAARRARNRMGAGRPEEALEAATEAWRFYREHGPADRAGEAAVMFAQLTDDDDEAVEAFGVTLASGLDGPALAARVGRGRALMRLGRAPEAIGDLVEAVARSAELGLTDAGAFSRQDLAEAYGLAGRPIEAAEAAEEALSMFLAAGLDEPADNTRLMLAGLYTELGEKDDALQQYTELLDRLTGNPAGAGQVGEQYGRLLFDLDRDADAAEAFRVAGARLREDGDLIGELRLLRRRLTALHFADQVDAGEETIRLAADRWAELPGELRDQPAAIWTRSMTGFEAARLFMSRDRFGEALPHVRDAAEPLRRIGATDDADQVAGMYANALLATGSPAEAEALLRPMLDGMRPDAPTRSQAAHVLADALDALGRPDEATAVRTREGLNAR